MPVTYGFKKGTDVPNWLWLRQFPGGNSNPGTSNQYDGVRYVYWIVQTGTSATTASTTVLYRYDTWSNGWQFLATVTAGNQGMDLEYDSQRNVVYILNGGALTSWQVFNLNTTATVIAGVSCPAWTLTTLSPILLTAANLGSSFTQPNWQNCPGAIDVSTGVAPFTTTPTSGNLGAGTVGSGSTTTSLVTSSNFFTPGMIGLQVTFAAGTTTVALQGKSYIVSASTSATAATTTATMAGTPVAGDTFTVTLPTATSTGASSTTTLSDTNQTWTVNQYANSDVVITNGTGSGQRRRIASNTSTVLTLATAVTGNANTGVWTVTPDATSVYQIQPSSDFLYYYVANATTTCYKLDLSQTTGAAWTALTVTPATMAGGSNSFWPGSTAPFSLLMTRGSGTTTIYYYSIGLNSYITPALFAGQETFNTGSTSALIAGRKKLFISKEASQRNYLLDLTTGILEPFTEAMYAAPSAIDGKRARFVKTSDGVEWLYFMRAGGQEYWRIALEWL